MNNFYRTFIDRTGLSGSPKTLDLNLGALRRLCQQNIYFGLRVSLLWSSDFFFFLQTKDIQLPVIRFLIYKTLFIFNVPEWESLRCQISPFIYYLLFLFIDRSMFKLMHVTSLHFFFCHTTVYYRHVCTAV